MTDLTLRLLGSALLIAAGTLLGQSRLTDGEIRRGLTPVWLPLRDAVALFSRHQDYADTFEEKRGIYLREYTALREYEME